MDERKTIKSNPEEFLTTCFECGAITNKVLWEFTLDPNKTEIIRKPVLVNGTTYNLDDITDDEEYMSELSKKYHMSIDELLEKILDNGDSVCPFCGSEQIYPYNDGDENTYENKITDGVKNMFK